MTARGALLFHWCVSDLGCALQITMVKGYNWPLGTSRVMIQWAVSIPGSPPGMVLPPHLSTSGSSC